LPAFFYLAGSWDARKIKRIQMGRSNKEAKKSFVIELKKDIRDAKDTKDAEDVRLWVDLASRLSRYATLTG
jgi:hypothetical protein